MARPAQLSSDQRPIHGVIQRLSIDGIVTPAQELLLTVSNDAVENEKLGWVFTTRVKLNKNNIRVENKPIRLARRESGKPEPYQHTSPARRPE